jgi:hypothetical protein
MLNIISFCLQSKLFLLYCSPPTFQIFIFSCNMWSTIVVLASILFLPKVHLNFCELKADITFLVDKSGSIASTGNGHNYDLALNRIETVKSYILDSVKLMQLGEDKIRVAIATFNHEMDKLNTFNNRSSYDFKLFKVILNNLTYTNTDMRDTSNLAGALPLVASGLYSKNTEGRERIIIVMTDGDIDKRRKKNFFQEFREKTTPPFKIIAIGIGSYLGFKNELINITGNEALVLNLEDYADLPKHVNTLIAKVCSEDFVGNEFSPTIEPTSTSPPPSPWLEDDLPTKSNNRAMSIGLGVGGAVALLAAAAALAYFYKNKLAGGKTSTSNNGSVLRNSTENPIYTSSGETYENIMSNS